MKCTNCGEREATTRLLVSHGGDTREMFLCDKCASEQRRELNFPKPGSLFDSIFGGSPMGLLPNISELFGAANAHSMVCPECRTTSDEFLKTGFAGCPRCYEVFEPLVAQTVKKLQQSSKHIGKTPSAAVNIDDEEARLKAELQAAIDSGDYMRLGEIGNRLKNLTERNKENN